MDINFEYYKIFYYVAKYHNFTKAAHTLGCEGARKQPAKCNPRHEQFGAADKQHTFYQK